jgi:ubiquinone/menaquinone biosynthesis C-methylase UbiE
MSIAFDRAAGYYDRTRTIQPEILNAALDALVMETGITLASPVLEIGIGTGRIAVAMSERVSHLTGVDLSMGMMGVLQAKLGGTRHSLTLAQADVLELPFSDATFDLVYGVHVLHLVKGWQNAVTEAWRVLKTGGHFAVNFHRRDPEMPNVVLRKQLHTLVAPYGLSTRRPGAQNEQEYFAELSKWDAQLRVIDVGEWTEIDRPAQVLAEIDGQIHSETWSIPRPVMDEVMPELRAWALDQYGDLDREFLARFRFRWLIATCR